MSNVLINEIKLSAIIVTYYPDTKKLSLLLEKLISEKIQIIIVDNSVYTSEDNCTYIENLDHQQIHTVKLKQNFGIAAAQNIAIDIAKKRDITHVIFFDQDSLPDKDMISALLNAEKILLLQNKKIGALGPIYKDTVTNQISKPVFFLLGYFLNRHEINNHIVKCDFLISSGSLIRIKVFENVGRLNEDLFIDGVDLDWILRASEFGYSHYMINDAKMLHAIGDKNAKFLGISFGNHTHARNFYKIRNLTYLLFFGKNSLRFKLTMLLRIPIYALIYMSSSNNKLLSLKYLFRAFEHALLKKLGPFDNSN